MKIAESLSAVALRPFVDGLRAEGADPGQALAPFGRHSERVREALGRACEHTWKTLEVALAGPGWWERCRQRLQPGEEAVLGHKVRAFFDPALVGGLPHQEATVRQQCLHELRVARKSGALRGDLERLELIAQESAAASAPDGDARLLAQMAEELHGDFPALSGALTRAGADGQFPLAKLVRSFFRQQVEADPQLAQVLPAGLRAPLDKGEKATVAAIATVLLHHGGRLEQLLGLASRRTGVKTSVLDIEAETHSEAFPVPPLAHYVLRYLQRFELIDRELPPFCSLIIASESERRQVEGLAKRVHGVPEEVLRRLPALLDGLGLLQAAAGCLEAAQNDLQQAALAAGEPALQAVIYYHAYQAALEAGDADAALANLQRAARLDPKRFSLFPLEKFVPERLVHADPAGVRFLCKHRLAGSRVMVKTLLPEALASGVADIFRQARLLAEIDHPLRLHLRDHDFADLAKRRPYLVAEYFEGVSLAEQVQTQGPLPPADVLQLARPLAELLRAAHERGILHGQLEPACLLLRKDGASWKAKLLDFGHGVRPALLLGLLGAGPDGLARSKTASQAARLLGYLAPEQLGLLDGAAPGQPSDVYGFGRLCYFALLGDAEPDDEQKKSLSEPWRRLLARCTTRGLARRLANFEAVLKLLAAIPAGQTAAPGPAAAPPALAESYLNRGMAYKRRGNHSKAIAAFSRAIQLDPKLTAGYIKRGNTYLDSGDFDKALADYSTVVGLEPNNAVAYMNRGLVHAQQGSFDTAIADCSEAIRLDPKLAAAYSIRGMAFWERGDRHRAIAEYSLAIRFDPTNALTYNGRGLAYFEDQEYERALGDFKEALRHDPRLAVAYVNRGNVYRLKQRPDQAIADYNRALQLEGRNAPAYFNRGLAYLDKKEFAQALGDFSRVLQLEPKHPEAAARREEALRAQQRGPGAQKQARPPAAPAGPPLKADPPALPTAAAPPSRAEAPAVPTPAARGDAKRVENLPPRPQKSPAEKAQEERRQMRAAVYFASGRAAYDQGDYRQALDQYTKALQVDPKDALALYHRGLAYLAQDDFGLALGDFTESVRLNPRDATAHYQRGVAHRLLGQHDKAIDDYTQAIKLEPRLAVAYRNRGLAYAAKGEADKAKADYDRAVRLDPKLAKEG